MPGALPGEGAQVDIGFPGSSCLEQGRLRPCAWLEPSRAARLPHGGAGWVPQALAGGAGAPQVLCTSWEGLEASRLSRPRHKRGKRCPGRCQLKPGLARVINRPFVGLCLPGA